MNYYAEARFRPQAQNNNYAAGGSIVAVSVKPMETFL